MDLKIGVFNLGVFLVFFRNWRFFMAFFWAFFSVPFFKACFRCFCFWIQILKIGGFIFWRFFLRFFGRFFGSNLKVGVFFMVFFGRFYFGRFFLICRRFFWAFFWGVFWAFFSKNKKNAFLTTIGVGCGGRIYALSFAKISKLLLSHRILVSLTPMDLDDYKAKNWNESNNHLLGFPFFTTSIHGPPRFRFPSVPRAESSRSPTATYRSHSLCCTVTTATRMPNSKGWL